VDQDGLFTHVNNSIRQLAAERHEPQRCDFICECADLTCRILVTLTLVEFDERRAASPPLPILAAEHAA
jgi:hypothetical protein